MSFVAVPDFERPTSLAQIAVRAIYVASPSPASLKAREWQTAVLRSLSSAGFLVWSEVHVPSNGPGGQRGRIDLVARRGNWSAAIELDHSVPRVRSLFKLGVFRANVRLAATRSPVCRVYSVEASAPGLAEVLR